MLRFWGILFGVVLTLELALFAVSPYVNWWLPHNVAAHGPEVDYLFYLIFGLTGVFFVLTESILVYNMVTFVGPTRKAAHVHGDLRLELLWSAVPGALLVWIAFVQIDAWERIKYQTRMPSPDQVVEVTGRQFEWRMRYPSPSRLEELRADPKKAARFAAEPAHFDDIYLVNDLHLWKDANVTIHLKTRDVIHSLFLPNMRVKQDALPGKTMMVWFQAVESNARWDEGKKELVMTGAAWEIGCAELCGWGHYKMQGRVFVHPDFESYLGWLRHAAAQQSSHAP